jgi:hypothetical protein
MEMYQIVLIVLAAVFLMLYLQRRKSRLNRED